MSEVNKEETDDEGEEEEEEEEKKEDSLGVEATNTGGVKSAGLPKIQNTLSKANSITEEDKTLKDDRGGGNTKKYRFEELDPLNKSIFCPKSRSLKAEERFKMSAQEYLDTFKVATFLQDAFKTILDRRGDNAKSIFVQYLDSALKGEHILLREHAFVNATPVNRRCFLQQVRKVFHTTPCYKVVTALDYLQLLTLICSDFPKSLMIEAVKTLPVSETEITSTKIGEDLLFEKYDLGHLQCSVCIFFYYFEFMEGIKTIFQDTQKTASLDLEEQCSVITIYTAACNFIQRQKAGTCPLPTVENVLEALIYDTDLMNKLKDEAIVLADDIVSDLTGTISYKQFVAGMVNNRNLIRSLYEPIYSRSSVERTENLKKMAEELTQTTSKEQIKRTKSKKKKVS